VLDPRLAVSLWALRAALGAGCTILGIVRFNLAHGALVRAEGLAVFLLGVLLFTPLSRLVALLLCGAFGLVALQAFRTPGGGLGALDVTLTAAAFALAQLTRVNEGEGAAAFRRGGQLPPSRAQRRLGAGGRRGPRPGLVDGRPHRKSVEEFGLSVQQDIQTAQGRFAVRVFRQP
jgi:hypothetical protein